MTQPGENILIANGIILSEESNKLYCNLCTQVCANQLPKHIQTPSHVRRLEKFNSIFDNLKMSLRCKICGVDLNWKLLERHAIEHEITPWYKPEDSYRIFFENQTLQWENRFYCYPCDKVFPDWSSAFDHTGEERHEKLLKAQMPDDKTLADSCSTKSYESLVKGGFISWKNKTVACKICNCYYLGIQCVGVHIEGSRHKDSRFKLIEVLKDRVDRDIAAKRIIDNDITLTKGNNYWCRFCKCALADFEQVSLHIKEEKHKNSRWGLTANDEETKIPDEPIRKEMRKEPLDGAISQSGSLLPDYVVKNSDTDFHCTICNYKSQNWDFVTSHVRSKRHSTRRDKFKDNEISFKGNNNWHCGFCNYGIYNLNRVFAHMDDKMHKGSRMDLTANGKDSKIKNEPIKNETIKSKSIQNKPIKNETIKSKSIQNKPTKNERIKNEPIKNEPIKNEPIKNEPIKIESIKIGAIKQPTDVSSVRGSFLPDYIIQDSETNFYCIICDRTIIDRVNIEGHVTRNPHAIARMNLDDNKITFLNENNYHCGFCDRKIFHFDRISVHIDGYKHASSRSDLTANRTDSKAKSEPIEDETIDNERMRNKPIKSEPIKIEAVKQPVDGPSDQGILLPKYIVKKNGTDFYCTICKSILQNRDKVERHLKKKRHSKRLNKLSRNKISFKGDNNWYCGYCNYEIHSYDEASSHVYERTHKDTRLGLTARGTKSTSINEPICHETIEQPFDNANYDRGSFSLDCIIETKESVFHCPICNYKTLFRDSGKSHFVGNRHLKRRKRINDNKISFKGDDNWHCGFCNCGIHGIIEALAHIDENTHKESRSVETANSAGILNFNDPMIKKQPVDATNSDQASLLLDCILEYIDSIFHCVICDFKSLNSGDVKNHFTGNSHLKRRKEINENKISYKRDDNWHCGYCNCEIHGWDKVYVHIHKKTHQDSRSGVTGNGTGFISKDELINQETMKESSDYVIYDRDNVKGEISGKKDARRILDKKITPQVTELKDLELREPSERNLSHGFLVKINYTDWFCAICNSMVYGGQRKTNEHLAGNVHAMALRKYGCDNIYLVVPQTQDYYCRSCDCRIRGNESLWRHALGNEHATSANLKNDQFNKGRKILNGRKSLIRSGNFRLTKIGKLLFSESSGPVDKSRRGFISRIENQQIRDSEVPVRCNICDVKLANVVEFHSHLAGHFSKDFVRFNNEKGRNIKATNEEENKRLTRVLNLSTESLYTLASETENCYSSETPKIQLNKEKGEPGRLERTPKKPNIARILKTLNFDNDEIYSMKDKLRELELGVKLSHSSFDQRTIYCLVCQLMTDNTVENYFDHLCSLRHCVLLEKKEKDHALFDKFPEQFSAIDLGLQYMETVTGDLVRCRACDEDINDDDEALRDHIESDSHARACRVIRNLQKRSLDLVKLPMQCDWYKVQRYHCVPCLTTFRSEVNFVKHLTTEDHLQSMERPVNAKRQLIFDFCEACAILWYGYRRTCAYHRNIETHVWLIRDGHYISTELPRRARDLLAMPERYVNETIELYDRESDIERDKERTLIRDLENAVRGKYDKAKAHVFGSRVTGLGSSESDIDVFLDCGETYDGTSSRDEILKFLDDVFECLNRDQHSWVIEELIKMCKAPIIKVHHSPTGLSCDISFGDGLGVEKTLLIKSFIDVFPLCREMIIFLKRWTTLCELSNLITSYAIYWHVIFYLQRESILPSVAKLIATKNKSHKIAGWEVGVARKFTRNETNIEFRIRELLAGFFKFWSNFDHRYDVACPLIGKILKKRTFIDPTDLPKDMEPYVDYMRKSSNQEPLSIDSAGCIQDPFDLQYNLIQILSKVYVNRFRKYCSMSLDVLDS